MQLLGIATAIIVIIVGFMERKQNQLSFFDGHALFIILVGSLGAVLLASRPRDFIRTLTSLRELIPFLDRFSRQTRAIEDERKHIEDLWLQGNRAQATQLASESVHPTTQMAVQQVLQKSSEAYTENRFTSLIHQTMDDMECTVRNWELMSKLGPSFGIVGTITGMVQIFQEFGSQDANLGASMSLALLATLYGIAFGAGIAGPIGAFLARILDERIQAIERCALTTRQLIGLTKDAP